MLALEKNKQVSQGLFMRAIFQKKGKTRAKKCLKMAKKSQIFENLVKNVQSLKLF